MTITSARMALPVVGAVMLLGGYSVAQAQNTGRSFEVEEIVVTAQRREQSLQDVPISLQVLTGDDILAQGFTDMRDLSRFAPSVVITEGGFLSEEITIRGFGSSGNALTVEHSAPTFLDGAHMSRGAQIKLAFMDVDRVEVLKGPQPVFFGQNASAGAFSIISRRPTPEWEGRVKAELSSWNTEDFEFGVGGPLTDTVGIRLAGLYKTTDGPMVDILTGSPFPQQEKVGGRVILAWAPTDKFDATFKFEAAETEQIGSSVGALCLHDGVLRPNNQEFEHPQSLYYDPPRGMGSDIPHLPIPSKEECGSSNIGHAAMGGWHPMDPRTNKRITRGNVDIRQVVLDISRDLPTQIGTYWTDPFPSNVARGVHGDYGSFEDIKPMNSYLDLGYAFDNGIELRALTTFSDFQRAWVRDNRGAPNLVSTQQRAQDFRSWSQELRVTSQAGGTFEWMGGLYWQKDRHRFMTNSFRANVRRAMRYNDGLEDTRWVSAFATLTYNFLDERASIDIGGRYSDINKRGAIKGQAGNWIFPDGFVYPWGSRVMQEEHIGQAATGIAIQDPSNRRGPHDERFDMAKFAPQVVLRYRPTDEMSFYARYAEAFKAGGFDTGVSGINKTVEDFRFAPEDTEAVEVGVRGTAWGGRIRGGLSLFEQTGYDMQITVPVFNPDDLTELSSFNNVNAGEMRTRGAEFDVAMSAPESWVPGDLHLALSGAFLDGKMVVYPNAGCTDLEDFLGNCDEFGNIDRSGEDSPRTPDWQFTLDVDHVIYVKDRYEFSTNAKLLVSDAYLTNLNTFSRVDMMNQHEELNLSFGFGDVDGRWQVTVFGRNLLEAGPSYNEHFDPNPEAYGEFNNVYRSFGVGLRYNLL